jgi:hypothetical protein
MAGQRSVQIHGLIDRKVAVLIKVSMAGAQQQARWDLHICEELPLAETEKLGKETAVLNDRGAQTMRGAGTGLAMSTIARIARLGG